MFLEWFNLDRDNSVQQRKTSVLESVLATADGLCSSGRLVSYASRMASADVWRSGALELVYLSGFKLYKEFFWLKDGSAQIRLLGC